MWRFIATESGTPLQRSAAGSARFRTSSIHQTFGSIEFVRGPNSAQYGPDSAGGTVNLQSPTPILSSGAGLWNGEVSPLFHSATNGFGGNAAIGFSAQRFGFVSNLAARRVNTFRTGGGIDSHAAVTRFLGLPSTVIGSERLPDSAFKQYGGRRPRR